MPRFPRKLAPRLAVAACATLAGAQLGLADGLGPQPRADAPWVVSFTPYGWLPFLTGDVTVRGRTVAIDVNPIEVFEDLDALPWMSYAEARKGPLAFYNDIFYAKLGVDASRARFLGAATLDATLGLDFEQAVIEVGGAYQVGKWWSGGGGSIKDSTTFARYTALDVIAGARYWHQDLAINLDITGTLDTTGLVISGSRAIARSGSVDWVDPLVGLRVRHQVAPGQELMLRADVGGFDVGSQFSWNAIAAYSWHIAIRDGISYSGMLGYRALSVDFEKGSGTNRYEYDVVQHGPIVGLTARF
jgi:hypothetical protein